ncbi:hypothetical protein A4X13_0g7181 [Tilletia indica]|uniref:Uncharacterized protein n=1 Tax=Tilletia indica TaxID=43049 RepID=A0A8T8SL37_9BASI|nr:hypothetical protein A4X13_0g7181 [Tilletia indica]
MERRFSGGDRLRRQIFEIKSPSPVAHSVEDKRASPSPICGGDGPELRQSPAVSVTSPAKLRYSAPKCLISPEVDDSTRSLIIDNTLISAEDVLLDPPEQVAGRRMAAVHRETASEIGSTPRSAI